jgi:hypothetical protein
MRRSANVLALLVATVTGAALLAGSATAASARPQQRVVRLTIHAIDQNGHPEQIANGNYAEYGLNVQGGLTSGANYLSAGRYAIGVEVPTLDSQGNDIANTVIARNVNVQHNMTLTLSARNSVPVQVSLNGVQQSGVMGNVCASTGGIMPQPLIYTVQGPPPLYIVPYRSKTLRFVYQATSTIAGATQINLGGSFAGLPAKPVASFTSAGLAKVSLRVTAGAVRPWSGDEGNFFFSPGGQACGATQSSSTSLVFDPSITTEYFSPGTWLPTFIPYLPATGSVGDTLTDTYAAGRSYSDSFYGAAWGPDFSTPVDFPVVGVDSFAIADTFSYVFADPAGLVGDPDGQAVVSLTWHRRTLARLHLRNLDEPTFSHVVHHSGWYTLALDATRALANDGLLLSPQLTVRWRFYASISQPGEQLPLSYTQYRVGGLSLENQAAPGARTTIAVSVVGPSGAPNNGRAWREVKMQVSDNGGSTWQTLKLNRRGRVWTLTFREPVSGDVSLRSTVVSTDGDSSVQTIYDAYGIG